MKSSDTFLTAPQVLARYGISDMSLYRWLNDPDLSFPKPMTINRRRYFKEADLIAWERDRAASAA